MVCSIRQLGLVKKELEGALGILRRVDDVGAGDGGRVDSVALKERGAHETIRTGDVHSTACAEVHRKLLHLLLYQLKLTENGCIFCCISSLQKTVASFVVSAAYRKLLHLLLYQLKLTENYCIFCCISRSLNCCILCCIIRSLQKAVASFVVSAEAYRKLLHLLLYQQKLKLLHLFLYQQKLKLLHLLLYQLKLTENCCIFCCINRSLQKTVASFAVSSEAYRKLLHLLLYQQKLTENCCIFCCINRSLQKNCCIFCCINRSLQKTVASFVVSAEAYRKLLYLLLRQQKLCRC